MKHSALSVGALRPPCESAPFSAADIAFAFVFFVLGWLFWELQVFRETVQTGDFGTPVFTVLYLGAVLIDLRANGITPSRESLFWLGVTLCLGASFPFVCAEPRMPAFVFVHYAALLLSAQYGTLCAAGRLLGRGRTSNWLAFDVCNACILVPLGNFFRLPAVVWGAGRIGWACMSRRGAPHKTARRLLAGALGVAAGAACLCVILPLLAAADAGFSTLLRSVAEKASALLQALFFPSAALRAAFAVPTALYLYGTVYGCIHARRTHLFTPAEICPLQRDLRCVPPAAAGVALGMVCAAYALFAALQASYLFASLGGALPDGFSYAEYARQGFFELCRLAAFNLALLGGVYVLVRREGRPARSMWLFNRALCVLTLLLIATAAAKMGLYIAVYGLTEKRILASVFLVWTGVLFVLLLVVRPGRIAPVRAAVFIGAVLFCAVCVFPIRTMADSYNRAFVYDESSRSASVCENFYSLP